VAFTALTYRFGDASRSAAHKEPPLR